MDSLYHQQTNTSELTAFRFINSTAFYYYFLFSLRLKYVIESFIENNSSGIECKKCKKKNYNVLS